MGLLLFHVAHAQKEIDSELFDPQKFFSDQKFLTQFIELPDNTQDQVSEEQKLTLKIGTHRIASLDPEIVDETLYESSQPAQVPDQPQLQPDNNTTQPTQTRVSSFQPEEESNQNQTIATSQQNPNPLECEETKVKSFEPEPEPEIQTPQQPKQEHNPETQQPQSSQQNEQQPSKNSKHHHRRQHSHSKEKLRREKPTKRERRIASDLDESSLDSDSVNSDLDENISEENCNHPCEEQEEYDECEEEEEVIQPVQKRSGHKRDLKKRKKEYQEQKESSRKEQEIDKREENKDIVKVKDWTQERNQQQKDIEKKTNDDDDDRKVSQVTPQKSKVDNNVNESKAQNIAEETKQSDTSQVSRQKTNLPAESQEPPQCDTSTSDNLKKDVIVRRPMETVPEDTSDNDSDVVIRPLGGESGSSDQIIRRQMADDGIDDPSKEKLNKVKEKLGPTQTDVKEQPIQEPEAEPKVTETSDTGDELLKEIIRMPSWDNKSTEETIIGGATGQQTDGQEASNEFVVDPTQFSPHDRIEDEEQDEEQNQVKGESQEKQKADKTIYLDSSFESEPVLEHTFDDQELEDPSEYGFGMWLRYLSTYPEKHTMDPNQFYFIVRMTSNRVFYDYRNFGDRTLAVWMLRNIYIFTTYDQESKNKNMDKNIIKVNTDNEAKWYFLQFGYNLAKKTAQGYLSRGTEDTTSSISVHCTHAPVFFLKLIVGGQHMHYNGFNGQIANLYYGVGKGLFIPNVNILLKFVITKIAPLPMPLKHQVKQDLITIPLGFSANEQQDKTIVTDDTCKMAEEYSVSGWIRWVADIVVNDPTAFLVFNLRQNVQRGTGMMGSLGDRDLEVQFVFGAQELGSLYYNTYTTLGNNGHGNPLVTQKLLASTYVWTFIYYGYSTSELQSYAVQLQPNSALELTQYDIIHKLAPTLYLFVGSEPKIPGFNGKMAYFSLYLGPKTFRKGLTFEYTFNFGQGASILFQHKYPITLQDKDEAKDKVRSVAFDQDKLIDFTLTQDDIKTKINGQSEYGFGMWTRWMRTAPKYLVQKQLQHMIGRLTTRKRYMDNDNLKDRTLAVFVGEGAYQFSTYDSVSNTKNLMKTIDYKDQLDGQWNYIYFSYKRFDKQGMAVGHLIFQEKSLQQKIEIDCLHFLVINYLTFVIKKEFNIPLFNGYMSKITFKIGPGSYIVDGSYLNSYIKESLALPMTTTQQQLDQRKTIVLMKAQENLQEEEKAAKPAIKDQGQQQIFDEEGEENLTQNVNQNNKVEADDDDENSMSFTFAEYEGIEEYSISGWGRWAAEERTGQTHQLVLLSQKPVDQIKTGKDVGDQTLSILRIDGSYRFQTYTCKNLENECKTDIYNDQPFFNYWDEWTYFYFGYQHSTQKCFGYLKYTFRDSQFEIKPVIHLYMSTFTVTLGKGRVNLFQQFQGFIKSWVVNVGDGSYQEGGFLESEGISLHYGLQGGSDHQKIDPVGWQPNQPGATIDCSADVNEVPLESEFLQNNKLRLSGIMEYGYGYWKRFIFFGATKLIQKPQWLGMSRLTSNKEYHDMESYGDRMLAIWMGRGFYHFATYNTDPPTMSVSANIVYSADSEGTWVYIYFSYKRFAESEGRAIAYASIHGSVSQVEINEQIVHNPLNDYLLFMVGYAGSNYKNFNGQIKHVKLNLGPGSFIESKLDLHDYQKSYYPQPALPEFVSKTVTILTDHKVYKRSSKTEIEPIDFGDEFRDVPQYAMNLWFRSLAVGVDKVPLQTLYRLTQNEKPVLQDFQNPGDRTLSAFLTQKGNVLFSTYSSQDEDQFKSPLNFECQIAQEKQQLWTYIYFAYNHQVQQVSYYVSVDGAESKGEQRILHRTSNYFALYIAHDEFYPKFNGKIGHVYLSFGDGSYVTEKHNLLSGYVNGLKALVISKLFIWDAYKEERIDISSASKNPAMHIQFREGKYKIDSISEYSHGYWCRYLTAIPVRIIQRPPIQQISRFTDKNMKINQNNRLMGDRIMSIFLVPGSYLYSTYDSITANPSLQTTIQYRFIEGVWTFLYMGYRRSDQRALCYALFSNDQVNLQSEMINVLHYPLGEYAEFMLGGIQPGYSTFQGQIAGVAVRFGPGSLVTNVNQLREEVELYYSYKMSGQIYEQANEEELAKKTLEDQVETIEQENEELGEEGSENEKGNPESSKLKVGIYDSSGESKEQDNPEEEQIVSVQFQPMTTQERIAIIDEKVRVQKTGSRQRKINKESKVNDQDKIANEDTEVNTFEDQKEQTNEDLDQTQDVQNQQNEQNQQSQEVFEEQITQNIEQKQQESKIEENLSEELQDMINVHRESIEGVIMDGTNWREVTEYIISGWFKWVPPKRVQECHTIFRFTNNEVDYRTDSSLTGDKTLSAVICPPKIRAYTYTIWDLKDSATLKTLNYEVQMDEYLLSWNYIYMGYSDTKATVHILIQKADGIEKYVYQDVKHIVPNYLGLFLGKDTFLPNFNGYMQKWNMNLGDSSFLSIASEIMNDNLPQINAVKLNQQRQWSLQYEENFLLEAPQLEQIETETVKIQSKSDQIVKSKLPEKSKSSVDKNNQVKQVKDKLSGQNSSDDEKEGETIQQQEQKNQEDGENTEAIVDEENQESSEERNDIDKEINEEIDQEQLDNSDDSTQIQQNLQNSNQDNLDGSIDEIEEKEDNEDNESEDVGEEDIEVTNEVMADNGEDGKTTSTKTVVQKPQEIFRNIKSNNLAVIDLEFSDEAEAALEYSFSMWTRWLQDYPDKLKKRSTLHSIARLTTNRDYSDAIQFGDRTLAVFVAVQRYVFSTYDTSTTSTNIQGNVPYEGQLEGQWNFISFSFKRFQAVSEAVGYVYTSRTEKVQRIQFKVSHRLMTGYARFIVAPTQFGDQAFHGWIYDPRVSFGVNSFVPTETDLLERIIVQHHQLPVSICLSSVWKPNFQRLDTMNPEDTAKHRSQLVSGFSDKQEAIEYSVSLWFQLDVTKTSDLSTKMILYRLSTNTEDVQQDNQFPGDRTLLLMTDQKEVQFNSYRLSEPKYDEVQNTLKINDNKYQWVFAYYGHSNSEMLNFAFLQFPDRQDSILQQDIYHIVPSYFRIQIVQDSFLQNFYVDIIDYIINFKGKLQGFKLMFGAESYTQKPSYLINEWPYNPKQSQDLILSVQLYSRGMNSAQIVRKKNLRENVVKVIKDPVADIQSIKVQYSDQDEKAQSIPKKEQKEEVIVEQTKSITVQHITDSNVQDNSILLAESEIELQNLIFQ